MAITNFLFFIQLLPYVTLWNYWPLHHNHIQVWTVNLFLRGGLKCFILVSGSLLAVLGMQSIKLSQRINDKLSSLCPFSPTMTPLLFRPRKGCAWRSRYQRRTWTASVIAAQPLIRSPGGLCPEVSQLLRYHASGQSKWNSTGKYGATVTGAKNWKKCHGPWCQCG